MEENKFLKHYNLSDLFDGTFKMLKYTWKNTLIISVICFIPLSFVSMFLLGRYFNSIISLINTSFSIDATGSSRILGILPGIIWTITLLTIITTLITLFVKACVALNTFKAAYGEEIGLKDLVMTVLKEKFGKLIVQSLLFVVIFAGVCIAAGIALGLIGVIFTLLNRSLGMFMVVVGVLAFYGLLIWLGFSFAFINEEVIFTDTPVAASFKKSFNLVKGNWWRVFGILILFGLVLSFAVSIVTSPLTFSMMASAYSDMFENLLNRGSITEMYKSLLSLYSKAFIPLAIATLISSILTYLISPVFSSLFYLDLKIRKKEITLDQEPSQEEAGWTDMEEDRGTDSDQQ